MPARRYECATLSLPFSGVSHSALSKNITSGAVVKPSSIHSVFGFCSLTAAVHSSLKFERRPFFGGTALSKLRCALQFGRAYSSLVSGLTDSAESFAHSRLLHECTPSAVALRH
jgi:hypothetical protein